MPRTLSAVNRSWTLRVLFYPLQLLHLRSELKERITIIYIYINIPGAVGADRSASNRDGKGEVEGSRATAGDMGENIRLMADYGCVYDFVGGRI